MAAPSDDAAGAAAAVSAATAADAAVELLSAEQMINLDDSELTKMLDRGVLGMSRVEAMDSSGLSEEDIQKALLSEYDWVSLISDDEIMQMMMYLNDVEVRKERRAGRERLLEIADDFGLTSRILRTMIGMVDRFAMRAILYEKQVAAKLEDQVRPSLTPAELKDAKSRSVATTSMAAHHDVGEGGVGVSEGPYIVGLQFRVATSLGNAMRHKYHRTDNITVESIARATWVMMLQNCKPEMIASRILYEHVALSSVSYESLRNGKPVPTIDELMSAIPDTSIPTLEPDDERFTMVRTWTLFAYQFLESASEVWDHCPVLRSWLLFMQEWLPYLDEPGTDRGRDARRRATELIMQYHNLMESHYSDASVLDDAFLCSPTEKEFRELGVREKWSNASPEVRLTCFDFINRLNDLSQGFSIFSVVGSTLYDGLKHRLGALREDVMTGRASLEDILNMNPVELMKFGQELFESVDEEKQNEFFHRMSDPSTVGRLKRSFKNIRNMSLAKIRSASSAASSASAPASSGTP